MKRYLFNTDDDIKKAVSFSLPVDNNLKRKELVTLAGQGHKDVTGIQKMFIDSVLLDRPELQLISQSELEKIKPELKESVEIELLLSDDSKLLVNDNDIVDSLPSDDVIEVSSESDLDNLVSDDGSEVPESENLETIPTENIEVIKPVAKKSGRKQKV